MASRESVFNHKKTRRREPARAEIIFAAATRRHSGIERAGFFRHTAGMGKTKIPATGEGFLGEIMVHKISRAVGVVDHVTEARDGWPPQIALKLPDGTLKKGRLSDFRDASVKERAAITRA